MSDLKCPICGSNHINSNDCQIIYLTSEKSCSSYIQEKERIHHNVVCNVAELNSLQQQKEEKGKENEILSSELKSKTDHLATISKELDKVNSKITPIKNGEITLEKKKRELDVAKKQLIDILIKIKHAADISRVKKYLKICIFYRNLLTKK